MRDTIFSFLFFFCFFLSFTVVLCGESGGPGVPHLVEVDEGPVLVEDDERWLRDLQIHQNIFRPGVKGLNGPPPASAAPADFTQKGGA